MEKVEILKQYNQIIMKRLTLGYMICIGGTNLISSLFEEYQGIAGNGVPLGVGTGLQGYSMQHSTLLMGMAIICMLSLFFGAMTMKIDKYWFQNVNLIIVSIVLTFMLIMLIKFHQDYTIVCENLRLLRIETFSDFQINLFWILLIFYVNILGLLNIKFSIFDKHYIFTFILESGFILAYTILFYYFTKYIFSVAFIFGVMIGYLTIGWRWIHNSIKEYTYMDLLAQINYTISPLNFFFRI